MSEKEERIRKITHLYYSRKDVQKAIFSFSKNREIVPRYFEGFGKRPDSLQYPGDIFELVKKGATSFHCSEELWGEPMKISTGMTEAQMNEQRVGWDLLLDIDSKYLDYSKIMAEAIFKVFKFHGIKNFGLKFSGSKGFHILVPWKAFPKEIHNTQTSDKFPEWPRIITKYIQDKIRLKVTEKINELNYSGSQYASIQKYIKREGGSKEIDYSTKKRVGDFIVTSRPELSGSTQMQQIKYGSASTNTEVMPDLILVSPRHLFRMPYSLHEKTALASAVLDPKSIMDFQPKDADPFKAEIKDFAPNPEEGEASELLREALDWYKTQNPEEESKKMQDFKPIVLKEISEKNFPPSISKILQGIKGDGRKRALFVILNFFRSIGMDRKDVEKNLFGWNEKNAIPLPEGYIKSQLIASYRGKAMPPPNFDKDYYRAVGIVPTEEEKRYKNPSNYMIKKSLRGNQENGKKRYSKDNFKNKN